MLTARAKIKVMPGHKSVCGALEALPKIKSSSYYSAIQRCEVLFEPGSQLITNNLKVG